MFGGQPGGDGGALVWPPVPAMCDNTIDRSRRTSVARGWLVRVEIRPVKKGARVR